MSIERQQFTFYVSFLKAISRIKSKTARCDAYDAIVNYALYGKMPDLEALSEGAAIAFELVKPNLDTARRKAKSGQKGGEANGKQDESKTEANGKQNGSKKEKEGEKEKEIEKEIEIDIEANTQFDDFWKAYPRKTGDVEKAHEEFLKAVHGGADPEELVTAAADLAARTPSEELRYVPAAEKWLRNKGWMEKPSRRKSGETYRPVISIDEIRERTERI